MKLTTIEDLKTLGSAKSPFIDQAMQLSKLYNRFLEERSESDSYTYTVEIHGTKTRHPGIHASEISNCGRMTFYSLKGVERRPITGGGVDVDMQRRFKLGHAVHAMLQADMHRMCSWITEYSKGELIVTFDEEVRISPQMQAKAAQWGLHSSCDGEFQFWRRPSPGALYEVFLRCGLEIKTESGPQFAKLSKPRHSHEEQTCFYMGALDLPLLWILYYNKSNSNNTASEPPWLFQFNHTLWDKLEQRFAKTHQQVASNSIPPREEGRHCGWCAFAWTCQPTYGAGGSAKSQQTHNRSLRVFGQTSARTKGTP